MVIMLKLRRSADEHTRMMLVAGVATVVGIVVEAFCHLKTREREKNAILLGTDIMTDD